jgi:hypothetical protein
LTATPYIRRLVRSCVAHPKSPRAMRQIHTRWARVHVPLPVLIGDKDVQIDVQATGILCVKPEGKVKGDLRLPAQREPRPLERHHTPAGVGQIALLVVSLALAILPGGALSSLRPWP